MIIFFTYYWKNCSIKNIFNVSLIFLQLTLYDGQLKTTFGFFCYSLKDICKQMTSFLESCVSCLSPWARQGIPASKKRQTLANR